MAAKFSLQKKGRLPFCPLCLEEDNHVVKYNTALSNLASNPGKKVSMNIFREVFTQHDDHEGLNSDTTQSLIRSYLAGSLVHCVVKDSLCQCGFYPKDLFKIISYQVSIFHCELVRGVWFNHQPVNFFHRLLGG